MIARTRSREELVGLLLTLHLAGLSCRVIARELGVSRNTVRRLLAVYIGARRKAPSTRFCSNGFFT